MKRILARLALFIISTMEITTALFLAFMLYKVIDLNDGALFWYGFVAGIIASWIGLQVILSLDRPPKSSARAKEEAS